MWTDSINNSPVFVDTQPSWEGELVFVQKWKTDILASFSGAEQRARRREQPLYSISYTVPFKLGGFAAARARMIRELQNPCVVPCWAHGVALTSIVSQTVTLNVTTLARSPFRAGSYAYVKESGKTSVFLSITAVGTTTLTIPSGNAAYPDIAIPAFTTAAIVYPCLRCVRDEIGADWGALRADSSSMRLSYTEL